MKIRLLSTVLFLVLSVIEIEAQWALPEIGTEYHFGEADPPGPVPTQNDPDDPFSPRYSGIKAYTGEPDIPFTLKESTFRVSRVVPGAESQKILLDFYELLEENWAQIQGAPESTRMRVLQTLEPTLFLINDHEPSPPEIDGGSAMIAYRSSEPIEIVDGMWLTRPIRLAGTYEYTSVSGAGKKVLLYERNSSGDEIEPLTKDRYLELLKNGFSYHVTEIKTVEVLKTRGRTVRNQDPDEWYYPPEAPRGLKQIVTEYLVKW